MPHPNLTIELTAPLLRTFDPRYLALVTLWTLATGCQAIFANNNPDPQASNDTSNNHDSKDDVASDVDGDIDSSDDESATKCPDEDKSSQKCRLDFQDCPEGQKCTGKLQSLDSTYVDDAHCVDLIGNKKFGERCWRDATLANDDCGRGLFCLAGCTACEGEGKCIQFCGPQWLDLSEGVEEALQKACEVHGLVNHRCFVTADGIFNVCLQPCDPLSPDCPENEGCFQSVAPWFICRDVELSEGESGIDGSVCRLSQSCLPGNLCALSDRLDDCDSDRCCTPFCDLNDSEFKCPNPAEQCFPVFESPQSQSEHVGMCAISIEK